MRDDFFMMLPIASGQVMDPTQMYQDKLSLSS